MKKNLKEKRLFSVKEAAVYLNISPRSIYNRVCRRSKNPFPVKHLRIGSSIKFDIEDLDAFVESQKK
jgi:excisionase family DNA binding protein